MTHILDSSMIYNDVGSAKLASDHFLIACDLAYLPGK